jgi:hypothetical protein
VELEEVKPMGEAGTTALSRWRTTWTSHHPRSGAAIEGFVVPDWAALRDVVPRAAAALATLPCIGWDVTVTDAGPAIIEANRQWRFDVLQRPHRAGLWQGEFRQWCEARLAERPQRGRTA